MRGSQAWNGTSFDPCSGKTELNAYVQSVIPDYPVQAAKANQVRQCPPKLDFAKKTSFLTKNAIKAESAVRD